MRKPPAIETVRRRNHRSAWRIGGCAARFCAREPSTSSTQAPSVDSEAPPTMRMWVGPHSVTSWPNSRCQTSSSGKPTSAQSPHRKMRTPPSGRVPVASERDRCRRLGARPDDEREQPAQRDAGQAEQDRVVGHGPERAGVAAVVDVLGHVPVEAERRDQQRAAGDGGGEGGPAGQAGHARGEVGHGAEPRDAAGAVGEAHPECEQRQCAGDCCAPHEVLRGRSPCRLGSLRNEIEHTAISTPFDDTSNLVP